MPAYEPRFYEMLIDQLDTQIPRTLDIYSVSACFGFYSRGMKAFASVLQALDKCLGSPAKTQVRMLLMTDDNLIDTFAIERIMDMLGRPHPETFELRQLEVPEDDDEAIQFALFGTGRALVTRPQVGSFDNYLALPLNKLADARYISQDEDSARFRQLQSLFHDQWQKSSQFTIPFVPSLGRLSAYVKDKFPVHHSETVTKAEYVDQLHILLHGLCPRDAVIKGYNIGATEFDLVVGDQRQRLTGIYLRVPNSDPTQLSRMVEEIKEHRMKVQDLLVILVGRGIGSRELHHLEDGLRGDRHIRLLHLPN